MLIDAQEASGMDFVSFEHMVNLCGQLLKISL